MTMTALDLKETERTRVELMGYHRPVSAFNIGKNAEHRERRHFTEFATIKKG